MVQKRQPNKIERRNCLHVPFSRYSHFPSLFFFSLFHYYFLPFPLNKPVSSMRFFLHFDSISISISISISLLFYSTMPTIAGPSSSPHKHIVAARSENTGVPEVNTPRKRKLRSDSAAEVASTAIVTESSFATPMKWKSPRRCAVSSPKTLKKVIQWAHSSYPLDLRLEIRIWLIVKKIDSIASACLHHQTDWFLQEDSKGKLDSPVMSAVKDRFDCLDVKSKWNPRGIHDLLLILKYQFVDVQF